MIDANETLGEIATIYPVSRLVFLRHKLDFCCGGGKTLAAACSAIQVDPQAVIDEILEAAQGDSGEARWDQQDSPAIIDFIVTHYHDGLRADLPGLLEAARRVERVHASKPTCPTGLAAELYALQEEVLPHLRKEEQVLFPALSDGVKGFQIEMPIRAMMYQHNDHGEALVRIRKIATDFVAPPEACGTWRALYDGLARLERELMEHIHLENNILFPRALPA